MTEPSYTSATPQSPTYGGAPSYGSQPPTYGAQATYGPQPIYGAPYGTPQGGLPGYPPVERPRNGFAVAALVLSILGGGLLSVIFAFVALGQVGPRGQRGKGMAIASLVITAAWVVVLFLLALPVFLEQADRDASGTIEGAGTVSVDTLRTGDCFDADWLTSEATSVYSVDALPCSSSHGAEVYASFEVPDASEYPGEESVLANADAGCLEQFQGFVGMPYDDSVLEMTYLYPVADSWSLGDREITCIVFDPAGPSVGSLAGAGR